MPGVSTPKDREHSGVRSSVTSTGLSGLSPVLRTVIFQATWSPPCTTGGTASLETEIAGVMRGTFASAVELTTLPSGSMPFTAARVPFGSGTVAVQVPTTDWPGARAPMARAHEGTAGSAMVTSCSGTSPVLLVLSVKVA
ncbi:hypothetical protein [Amycolatopsis sp. CFH S0078]|uniref:hypothetical protein n=1 Tax=Amycolatopsis sp. CFH S0078 TaxID=1644108 RepID=UPI001F0FC630|nr:hypothetical protein [Amycolatopsis sp. CFH S0078]